MMLKTMFSSTFVASRPSVISHKGLSKKAGAAVIRRRRRRSAAPVGVSGRHNPVLSIPNTPILKFLF